MSTTEPPLPHLTGKKFKSPRKPAALMDKNTAELIIGLSIFLFALFLFMATTIPNLVQSYHGWTAIVWVLVFCLIAGFSASVWLFWHGIKSYVKSDQTLLAAADAISGEFAVPAHGKTHKPKPLALAIIFFVGFVFEVGNGVLYVLSLPKSFYPSPGTIAFTTFCSLGCLGGSIWAFRWWLRERKATRT